MAGAGSSSKLVQISTMLVVMMAYSLVEVAFSLKLHSLVMFSDGLHNLSDGVALMIAFWAEYKKLQGRSDKLTYGWRRTEVLGGLFNGTFLLSMCVFVLLQAVPRFFEVQETAGTSSWEFIIVAASGIVLNILGTVLFAGHGHSHSHGGGGGGGHGHSHGAPKRTPAGPSDVSTPDGFTGINGDPIRPVGSKNDERTPLIVSAAESTDDDDHAHHVNHNLWGLFIHFVGDVLTSLLVLGVGLCLHYFPPPSPLPAGKHPSDYWVNYLDPGSSVVVVAVICLSAWPLVRSCSWIFLQGTPRSTDMAELRKDLLGLGYVLDIHELHVWQLVDGMSIASMHVALRTGADFEAVFVAMRSVLHNYGIHSSTIQPENEPSAEDISSGKRLPVGQNACILPGVSCIETCKAEPCCEDQKTARKRLKQRRNNDAIVVVSDHGHGEDDHGHGHGHGHGGQSNHAHSH